SAPRDAPRRAPFWDLRGVERQQDRRGVAAADLALQRRHLLRSEAAGEDAPGAAAGGGVVPERGEENPLLRVTFSKLGVAEDAAVDEHRTGLGVQRLHPRLCDTVLQV